MDLYKHQHSAALRFPLFSINSFLVDFNYNSIFKFLLPPAPQSLRPAGKPCPTRERHRLANNGSPEPTLCLETYFCIYTCSYSLPQWEMSLHFDTPKNPVMHAVEELLIQRGPKGTPCVLMIQYLVGIGKAWPVQAKPRDSRFHTRLGKWQAT